MTTLNGKIALITGASRGIGQAIALELGNQGAFIIGTATTAAGADKISSFFAENGIKGRGEALNVTDSTAVNDSIQGMVKEFGAIHILVNNAGITKDNLLMRLAEEDWQQVIDTNLTGVFRVTKACLRAMLKAKWGRIINISSIVGATGNPGQANYCAAKAGLFGFSKSLAQEVASRNITVNVVAPGFIATDMTENLTAEQKQAILTAIPMGKIGSADDIAAAVAYLASDSAGYVTGQTIHVNGGMSMV